MDTAGRGTGKSTFGKVISMTHETIRMLICDGFRNSAELQGYNYVAEWIRDGKLNRDKLQLLRRILKNIGWDSKGKIVVVWRVNI